MLSVPGLDGPGPGRRAHRAAPGRRGRAVRPAPTSASSTPASTATSPPRFLPGVLVGPLHEPPAGLGPRAGLLRRRARRRRLAHAARPTQPWTRPCAIVGHGSRPPGSRPAPRHQGRAVRHWPGSGTSCWCPSPPPPTCWPTTTSTSGASGTRSSSPTGVAPAPGPWRGPPALPRPLRRLRRRPPAPPRRARAEAGRAHRRLRARRRRRPRQPARPAAAPVADAAAPDGAGPRRRAGRRPDLGLRRPLRHPPARLPRGHRDPGRVRHPSRPGAQRRPSPATGAAGRGLAAVALDQRRQAEPAAQPVACPRPVRSCWTWPAGPTWSSRASPPA